MKLELMTEAELVQPYHDNEKSIKAIHSRGMSNHRYLYKDPLDKSEKESVLISQILDASKK